VGRQQRSTEQAPAGHTAEVDTIPSSGVQRKLPWQGTSGGGAELAAAEEVGTEPSVLEPTDPALSEVAEEASGVEEAALDEGPVAEP